jgi:hypothetical protein
LTDKLSGRVLLRDHCESVRTTAIGKLTLANRFLKSWRRVVIQYTDVQSTGSTKERSGCEAQRRFGLMLEPLGQKLGVAGGIADQLQREEAVIGISRAELQP